MAHVDNPEHWAKEVLAVYNDLKTKEVTKPWLKAVKKIYEEYKTKGGKGTLEKFTPIMSAHCHEIQPPTKKKTTGRFPKSKDGFPRGGYERVKEMLGGSFEGAREIFGDDYSDWAGLA